MLKDQAIKKWRGFLVLFVVIAFASASISYVFADQNRSPVSGAKRDKKPNRMDGFQKLTDPPADFPDLPLFHGKTTFVGGYYQPETNGNSICQMTFLAQEEPHTIIDFYKDAFTVNGWKVIYSGSVHISARHVDGHMCSVNVSESKLPKTKSQYTIAYRRLVKPR